MSKILTGILLEAADQSWLPAYKALEANGGEPDSSKGFVTFIKQLAILAKSAKMFDERQLSQFIGNYVSGGAGGDMKARQILSQVRGILSRAPSMDELEQFDKQNQVSQTNFQQQQHIGQLQHDLTAQQLLHKHELDTVDQQHLLSLDMDARLAIQKVKQDLELDAKERLIAIQREVEDRNERKEIRDHEMRLAQAGYDHEVNVINARAEGEYKKAKLEADYQIKVKELENIDNAGERQNKLDQINADKARQIEIIDAETNAKVRVLQKEVDVERQQNDIAIEKAYMMTFNPIWGAALSAAHAAGATWDAGIRNLKKALKMLASPVMPQAVKEAGMSMARMVNKNGLTQDEWMKKVLKAYPEARIIQAKMMNGPCHAFLPDGRKASWIADHEIDNVVQPQGMAEAKKANTKTARKEFGKRPPAKLSDKEQEQKKSESDEAWERLMAYAASQKKEVKEGDSFGSFAGLKDWQVWNVHVYNNYYRGKYADYGPRLYSVVASSPDEARQIVISNADYVLKDLLSRKLQSGKKVLPRGSALPVEEKRVGKAEPGSITTVGFKEMLTPDGPMKLKFANGKIVASEEQTVDEGGFDSDSYYNARFGGEYGRGMERTVEPSAVYHSRGDGTGEVGRPVKDKLKKSNLPADPFGRVTGKIPKDARPRKELDPFRDIDEGWKDTATLLGIPAVAGALAVGAGHLDKQQPHVEIGGQSARIVRADTTQMPRDTMLLKGSDGKMYRVWMTRGKGSGHALLAAPAEEVKESSDSDTTRLEQDVRDALENGDDYTAKQYAKMAPTPEAKKYLLNIIKQAMYIDDLGGETDWKGVAEGSLNEFAPPDSGDDRNYEYEVYQCNPNDQFDWIGGPIYKSDDMGKVHSIAYNLHKKHPDKAFMIWQERSQGSRGGYGIKDDEQGVAEGHADQQRKIFKKNGKPVGEVGIDRESSPGVGQWYMKCYATGDDLSGYDSYEEAVAELKHCLKQGVAEGSEQEADYGDDYQAMVQRVGQKAKEQEKKKPVDIQALAKRLNQPEKKSNILKGIEENLGTPYPGTYEEENKPFKKKGGYRITAMTSENKK